jgi:1-deoxy-D-xylulose-5-phosphate reductoisomerase
MGKKITIDSATLVNKGLEVIEAQRLFGLSFDRIDVVIHPESIIHSLVEFNDGSTLAQLGEPDMRLPIQYALTWPIHEKRTARRISLTELGRLTFEEPDLVRFPALQHCIDAGRAGDSYPTVLCAADQVAVDAFLAGRIRFPQIAAVIQAVIDAHMPVRIDSIDAIDHVLSDATRKAERIVSTYSA